MPFSVRPDAHVLLVDGDAARAAATRSTIASSKLSIVTAHSVADALAAIRKQDVALVLLESRVGDVDGVALARVIHQEAGSDRLPAIVLADAAPDPKWMARAGEAGIVDVIVRPADGGLLKSKVAHLLELGIEMQALRRQSTDRDRLLRANELMVAGLIHDLRTPLMAINLSAEVALVRSQDEAVQQAARRIRSSTGRMSRLFDHLLNLSRVSTESPALELKAGDLHAVAHGVVEAVRTATPAVQIDIRQEGDSSGTFDSELMSRSIKEMVDTLLAHAAPGDVVNVRVDGSHSDRLWVHASISTVISEEEQERMFVPGPTSAGREVPGFGLGLHRFDAYVRAHGGSVVGRSRSPEGTVFELLVPRDALAAG